MDNLCGNDPQLAIRLVLRYQSTLAKVHLYHRVILTNSLCFFWILQGDLVVLCVSLESDVSVNVF